MVGKKGKFIIEQAKLAINVTTVTTSKTQYRLKSQGGYKRMGTSDRRKNGGKGFDIVKYQYKE